MSASPMARSRARTRPSPSLEGEMMEKRLPSWAARCMALAPGPTTGMPTTSRIGSTPGSLKHPTMAAENSSLSARRTASMTSGTTIAAS